jgi:hypothetical protein
MFGGQIVNRKRLAGPDLMDCKPSAVAKYVREGMPFIQIGQVRWFDPVACFDWFKSHETRLAKPEGGGKPHHEK